MAIKSMTGFGESEKESGSLVISTRIRSVNNRFLDINLKCPSSYSGLESEISRLVRKFCKRGRIDINLKRLDQGKVPGSGNRLKFDKALFDEYSRVYSDVLEGKSPGSREFEIAVELLRRKTVLDEAERGVSLEDEREVVIESVSAALKKFSEVREFEGDELRKLLASSLEVFAGKKKEIEKILEGQPDSLKKRFETRMAALDVEVDPQRLEQEVALIIDRLDVSEELGRLDSHLKQFDKDLKGNGPVGRKLEFLLQELGREVNTLGSKSQDAGVSSLVIELKSILEKLREQVLNVE